jgi:acetyl-CoA carboxylase biotin carboxyl carrier protein
MNLKEIKEMIALMNENNLNELEMERGDLKIRIKKGPTGAPEQVVVQTIPTQAAAAEAEKTAAPAKAAGEQIKAPMVGTFYSAPSPEAPPFIEVGQTVEVGQVVCIIEAMKLMNEIKSEVKGKVIEVLAENAHPVEFGQPLFLIEPV